MKLSPIARRSLAVFVLAVLLRVLHLLHVVPTPLFAYHHDFKGSDMFIFDQWGQRIAAGDVLGRAPYQPLAAWQLLIAPESRWHQWYGHPLTFYKAPLYAYLVGALRFVWDDPMLPLALIQIAASGLCVVLLGRLGARLLGEGPGFAAALLFALYAPAIHYDVVMLRGPLIVLSSLLATGALLQLREQPTCWYAGMLGLAMALALLTNEGFAPVPLLILWLLLAWWGATRRTALLAGVFALGLLAGLTPVVLRNLAVGAPPLTLAVTGSTVLAVFNSANANPYAFDIRPHAVAPLIAQGNGQMLATALACLESFPSAAAVAVFYLKKTAGLLIPFENPDNANFYYAALEDPLLRLLPAYGTLLPLALVGLALLNRRLRELAPVMPFAAALLASILLTMTLSRYRVTLAVFLLLPAGLTLARLVAWAAAGRARAVATTLGAVASLAWASLALEGVVLGPAREADRQRYRTAEFLLGAEFYARRGLYDRAIGEAMELVRRNPDPEVQASGLLLAARLQLHKNDRARAGETLQLAARANPGDAQLLTVIGDLQRDALGDAKAAAGSYRQALALEPLEPLAERLRQRLARMETPESMR